MAVDDRYGSDVLQGFSRHPRPPARTPVTLARGLVVEHTASEWCGAVVGVRQGGLVELEDRHGQVRAFPLDDGFLLDGRPVTLLLPTRQAERARTASGSFAVASERARVAMPSRIFVEGRHDAELVEKVWGDDLRVEGVVVELLDGVDNLAEVLRAFEPSATRRAGVLVDHLVAGSKESRIAATAAAPYGAFVTVLGHPYVDVWQAVKPGRLGLTAWPQIPRSVEWKRGICRALGWPADDQADIADAWQRILARVRDYRDLEPALLGRMEELIDFVTVPTQ